MLEEKTSFEIFVRKTHAENKNGNGMKHGAGSPCQLGLEIDKQHQPIEASVKRDHRASDVGG